MADAVGDGAAALGSPRADASVGAGPGLVSPVMRVGAAWAWRFLIIAAALALVGYVLAYLSEVTIPLAVAILLAALLNPVKDFPVRKGMKNKFAAPPVFVAGIVIVPGLIAAFAGQLLAGLAITLFTLFFFLRDGRRIWNWVLGLTPIGTRAHLDAAADRAWTTLAGYVKATVLVASVDAVGIAARAMRSVGKTPAEASLHAICESQTRSPRRRCRRFDERVCSPSQMANPGRDGNHSPTAVPLPGAARGAWVYVSARAPHAVDMPVSPYDRVMPASRETMARPAGVPGQ